LGGVDDVSFTVPEERTFTLPSSPGEFDAESKFKSEPWVDCKIKGILTDPSDKSPPILAGPATAGAPSGIFKKLLNQVSIKLLPREAPTPPTKIKSTRF
jgi:hypothetical protein